MSEANPAAWANLYQQNQQAIPEYDQMNEEMPAMPGQPGPMPANVQMFMPDRGQQPQPQQQRKQVNALQQPDRFNQLEQQVKSLVNTVNNLVQYLAEQEKDKSNKVDEPEKKVEVVTPQTVVDPLQRQVIQQQQSNSEMRVGHYILNGAVYAFVDCLNPQDAWTPTSKKVAYDYRLQIGMNTAGIENFGAPVPLSPEDQPECLFNEQERIEAAKKYNAPVYRAIFRLVNGI